MLLGVQHSHTFLLFLSPSVFLSRYVLLELQVSMSTGPGSSRGATTHVIMVPTRLQCC